MINWIRSYYSNELESEIRIYNVVNAVSAFGFFCMSIFIGLFIKEWYITYLTVGMAVLFLFTILEANRTKRYTLCAIITSLVLNLVYFPILLIDHREFVSLFIVFLLARILYTLFILEHFIGILVALFEIIVYIFIIVKDYSYADFSAITTMDTSMYPYFCVVLVLMTVVAGSAVRFKCDNLITETKEAEYMKEESIKANVSKDVFLINMSHEIRTPMNAIVGTVDLLLNQDVNERVSDNLYSILNSCNALLSVVNELMNLSKEETEDIKVYVAKYDLCDLLMEIINMMSVRLMESSVNFFVNINNDIPRFLYGDLAKVKQVINCILNNSVKCTNQGKIVLNVDYKNGNDNNIILSINVTDSGMGIKEEEIPYLFNNNKKTSSLGSEVYSDADYRQDLLVCKDIVDKMKGSIDVKSTYGVGSSFSVSVSQGADFEEKVASVKDVSDNKVLIFEKNEEFSIILKSIFDGLNINCIAVDSSTEFIRVLSSDNFTHVFVDSERYKEVVGALSKRLNNEKVVVLSGVDGNMEFNGVAMILSRPVTSINVCSVFNNENNSYVREVIKKGGFICPKANILVVDDNFTNLNVARALLNKYEANVLTAISGKDALRILDEQNVDLIFLDYMMPEMDGIDTLNRIRKMNNPRCRTVPAVSLTANVVNGAREMFLDAGFDDFISKPISIDRMEKVLKKYLPKELIFVKN